MMFSLVSKARAHAIVLQTIYMLPYNVRVFLPLETISGDSRNFVQGVP